MATGSTTYNLTFVYNQDSSGRYGNMSCQTNGQTQGLCTNVSFNPANNQISTAGYGYDAAGNLTQDITSVPTMNYQYDAEGRLTTVTQGGNPFANITYNANGQAVSIVYPVYSNTKVDGVFDPAGQELGYYDGASGGWYDQDIWAAGRMIAQAFPASFSGGLTQFLHANALGSNAQITNQTGAVAYDILYYPWGQYWTHTGRQGDTHFAGFQQSGEPFGYLTPTRHYLSTLGRWMTPDPAGKKAIRLDDPQTWNMYAYVSNNPMSRVDPSGLNWFYIDDQWGGTKARSTQMTRDRFTPATTRIC